MTIDEACQVAANAAADLGYGREETDAHQMRVALVVLVVELHKARKDATS